MMRIAGAVIFIVLIQSGCSSLYGNRGYEFVPVVEGGSGLNSCLDELHDSRSMTPEQLDSLLVRREQDFLERPNFNNRINLVLLLAVGSETVQNKVRARELLEGIEQLPSSIGEQELVIILKQYLDQQAAATTRINELQQKMQEKEKRIDELEQQHIELMTIEKNIRHRDKAVEIKSGE